MASSCFARAARTCGVAVLFVTTAPALAQTPAQMEYERQQREYWRAQEQQREAERVRQLQLDNARRQEEFNRSVRPPGQGSAPADAGTARKAGGAGGGGGAMPAACLRKPLATSERNPLLGRWRPEKELEGRDSIEKLMRLPFAGPCVQFQLGIEFREREIGTGIVPAPAHYARDGDDWLVCLPASDVKVLRFRVQDPNRLLFAGQCTLVREGSAAATAATGTPAAVPDDRGATLSLAANVTGRTLLVLRKSVDAVLADAGIAPTAGSSRFKTWVHACESGAPACGTGKEALLAATAAAAKTDAGGNGRTPTLPVGTYYVFGQASESALWDVRVDLKPGANVVKLDARNATPVD